MATLSSSAAAPAVAVALSEAADAKITEVTGALRAYGEAHGLRGLEGRIKRGLDPAGMLAVPETRAKAESVAQALGASIDQVEALTKELHVGAIWKNADALAKAEDPNVQVWMILADVCTGDDAGDLDPAGFLADLENVNARLDSAVADPSGMVRKAVTHHVEKAGEKFTVEDGVPVSRSDDAFMHMAICGHEAGVMLDRSGLAFVGADTLDFEGVASRFGLQAHIKPDDRGRVATFYVRPGAGENGADLDVIKKLYPGFGIVLTGDLDVAKTLARTGMKKKQQAMAEVRGSVTKVTS